MSKPYESPQGNYTPPIHGQFQPGDTRLGDSGMVRQVLVVCILSFVQAGLELLYGVFALFLGPIMSNVFQNMPQGGNQPGLPGEVGDLISTIYTVLGLVLISVAILRILAAVLNLRFRSRALGIASLIVGLLPVLSIYCALTSIGLCVYGLIVFFNQDTKRAFELGKQGYSKDQILSAPRFG